MGLPLCESTNNTRGPGFFAACTRAVTACQRASSRACSSRAAASRPEARPTAATLRRTSSQLWSAFTSSTRTPALRSWSITTGGPASVPAISASGRSASRPSAESWRM